MHKAETQSTRIQISTALSLGETKFSIPRKKTSLFPLHCSLVVAVERILYSDSLSISNGQDLKSNVYST